MKKLSLYVLLWLTFISSAVFANDEVSSKLTAEIQFPYDNALVRGDVPVYGVAYGSDFDGYCLEYGEGINPKEWVLIVRGEIPCREGIESFDFSPRIGPVFGNLGTWETGLDNYYYKDNKVNLEGIYTLRLVVEGMSGKSIERRVAVEIGKVVTNVFGGIVGSRDKKVIIEVPEHALYDTALVMSVNPIDRSEIKLVVDPPYKLIGDIYEIRPSAHEFARDITLKIKCGGEKEGLAIYEYDLFKCAWVRLETECDIGWLSAKVNKLADGRSYYAVLYNPGVKGITSVRESAAGKSGRDTFEKDLGGWETYSGAALSRDKKTGDSGYCLKLTNISDAGYFAASVTRKKFNAKEYPVIEFDYKIPEHLRINLLVKAADRWYEVVFTDIPKTYLRINMKKVGHIPGVKADNKWHTAKINLYNMLIAQTKIFDVEQIILANFNSDGYMDLTPGYNPKGISYYIDNFSIRKLRDNEEPLKSIPSQGSCWELGIDDGSSDEFSYEKYEGQFKDSDTPSDFHIGDPYGLLERAVAFDDPAVNIYFDLAREDLNRDYLFYLDVCSCDLRSHDHVEFEVWLNDKFSERFICLYDRGDIYGIPLKRKRFRAGQNKITIKWKGGGNWLAWDYMRFAPVPQER